MAFQPIWTQFARVDDNMLEETVLSLVQMAVIVGPSAKEMDSIATILFWLSSTGIITRLSAMWRKAIAKDAGRAGQSLETSESWLEISALSKLIQLLLGNTDSSLEIAIILPDLIFGIVLAAGIGSSDARLAVYRLAMSMIRLISEFGDKELMEQASAQFRSPEGQHAFGLLALTPARRAAAEPEGIELIATTLLRAIDAGRKFDEITKNLSNVLMTLS